MRFALASVRPALATARLVLLDLHDNSAADMPLRVGDGGCGLGEGGLGDGLGVFGAFMDAASDMSKPQLIRSSAMIAVRMFQPAHRRHYCQ